MECVASIQGIGLESNSESFLVGMINSVMVFSQTSRGLTSDQKKIQASHVKSFINASVEWKNKREKEKELPTKHLNCEQS